jgi:hypothetical protein
MSPVREAGLTALREIRRNLASTKGIAMFVLFFLGGLAVSLVELLFTKLIDQETGQEVPAEVSRRALEAVLSRAYGAETGHYLSACPRALFTLFQGTLIFAPLLILLMGFDQIAGEIQHRSIRYIGGRSRRESIVAGKALGGWAVISAMVLLLHTTVWVVALVHGRVPAADILSWGSRLWFFSVVWFATYAGLITLVSSFFRTPIVALFVGSAVFFGVWLTGFILRFIPSAKTALLAFPGGYEALLLSPEPSQVLGGMGASLAWGAIMVIAAAMLVKRRDL